MWTERELPFLIERSKPVLSSTIAANTHVFNDRPSRPPAEKVFTLSNFKSGKLTGGVALGIGFLLFIMFLGRS